MVLNFVYNNTYGAEGFWKGEKVDSREEANSGAYNSRGDKGS